MRLLYPVALALLLLLPLLAWGHFGRATKGRRPMSPLVVRALSVIALILAIAGSQAVDRSAGTDHVFAVDVSDSVSPAGRAEAELFVADALRSLGPRDRAAIVLIGEQAAVERSLQPGLTRLTTEAVVPTGGTALADGILRSLSLFEDERQRRIVLLTDGQETRGSAEEAARVVREAGVRLSVVPIHTSPADGEVYVRDVHVPTAVRVDEPHEFSVVIGSAGVVEATVTVYRNDEYFGEDRIRLGPGDNVVRFQGVFRDRGVHRYDVRVTAPGDPLALNNEAYALVRVTGAPEVLYVARDAGDSVVNTLRAQGFAVRLTTPADMPGEVEELVAYDAVILDNVPAYDMSIARMEALERYVRDTGGGLLMIGGDSSYGAGGYHRTPIERLLPVEMDVTSAMRIPSLAMVFAIDKSGSMGAVEAGGRTRLDLVKEAVIAALEVMNPFYTVGLVAFDADVEWTVPMVRAGDRSAIAERLSRLSPGGGTVLEGALWEALRALGREPAAVKHLIILSDGLTADADFAHIIERMAADSITVSTVSIGSSADRTLMANLAEWGLGRSYHTEESRTVPRIFAAETSIVSRNLIVEETFVPVLVTESPVIAGVQPFDMPPLHGFVLTYHKPGAQMILSAMGDNPLLSAWQYGLGRSIAFTSDLRARWATEWLDWPGYARVLAQSVRWVQRPPGAQEPQVAFNDGEGVTTVVVDVPSAEGGFRNMLDVSAIVQPPTGRGFRVDLGQTAPGRYSATFPSVAEGTYLVTVLAGTDLPPRTYGMAVPYSREYTRFSVDYDRIRRIAEQGGGEVLSPEHGALIGSATVRAAVFRDALWRSLLVAAVVLLIAELVLTKLILPSVSRPTGPAERKGAERTRGPAGAPDYAEARQQVADAYRRESEEARLHVARRPDRH